MHGQKTCGQRPNLELRRVPCKSPPFSSPTRNAPPPNNSTDGRGSRWNYSENSSLGSKPPKPVAGTRSLLHSAAPPSPASLPPEVSTLHFFRLKPWLRLNTTCPIAPSPNPAPASNPRVPRLHLLRSVQWARHRRRRGWTPRRPRPARRSRCSRR
jgi:hypothetical protein